MEQKIIELIISSLISNLIFVGLFLIFFFFTKKSIIKKIQIKKVGISIILAILAFFLLLPTICLTELFFNKLGFASSTLEFTFSKQNIIIAIIFMCILPAICEELFFRGSILPTLSPLGKYPAVFLSALIFAFFHFSINQFIYPLFMGILFGVIMYKENNIIYTIVLHTINNLLALAIQVLGINLFQYAIWYIVMAIILLIIFSIIVIYIFKRTDSRVEKFNKKAIIISYSITFLLAIIWIISIF